MPWSIESTEEGIINCRGQGQFKKALQNLLFQSLNIFHHAKNVGKPNAQSEAWKASDCQIQALLVFENFSAMVRVENFIRGKPRNTGILGVKH